MSKKKISGLLFAGALLAAVPASLALADADVVDGASFTEVTDVDGIEGSSFYLYLPSEILQPSPMVTPVIYVYGDAPYETEDDAWEVLTSAGLDTIAEEENGVIIMVNPLNEEWGKEDLAVFDGIMSYISYVDGTEPLTYHSLQYVIGEGSGATFVNNYLTADCKRIAAVMTFGGELDEETIAMYPLPAYIVSGSQDIVDFYINANDQTGSPLVADVDDVVEARRASWETEETDEKTIYTYTPDDVKQVIVSKSESDTLDADLIADCWNTLFRYTARVCLTADFWKVPSKYLDTEFTLVKRPNYEEAGMEMTRVEGDEIWVNNDFHPYWYQFIPAAVQETMENGTDETYPLILCFHGGGDHPLYEAESMGWAQLCIDQNVIMVSPQGDGDDELNALIDYMIENYPVDESRIYLTGFSRGAGTAMSLASAYPERIAAMSPMSLNVEESIEKLTETDFDYDYDLPVCFVGQGLEYVTTDLDYHYKWTDQIRLIWQLDEIDPYDGELDYSTYPYWGFPSDDQLRNETQTGIAIWSGYQYDEDGVPMVALMHTEKTTHTHYAGYAELVWSWMSQFSRDTDTGEVIYTPND